MGEKYGMGDAGYREGERPDGNRSEYAAHPGTAQGSHLARPQAPQPQQYAPPQQQYASPHHAQPKPQPAQPQQPAKRGGAASRALAVLVGAGVVFLLAQVILGVVMVGSIGVGLASCARSCSDDPIGDSPQAAAFIRDLETNDRDLATFDALAGSFDAVFERATRFHQDLPDHYAEPLAIDELRALVAAGSWPKSPAGYGGADDHLSPQLWVRVAELSQDWIEGETGERWEVVDFSYPFPDNGPIPVPATRGEGSSTHTRLRCVSGDDAGLYVTVSYYRWRTPATFESDLSDARSHRSGLIDAARRVGESGLLEGRDFLLEGNSLYVWASGESDALRDPEAFVAFANEATTSLSVSSVSLLNADTPAVLRYNALSHEFPNRRPNAVMGIDRAQEELAASGYALELDYAASDELLHGSVWQDRDITLVDLSGRLAPDDAMLAYGLGTWSAPSEGSAIDEELAGIVAGQLGCDPADVIATSWFDGSDDKRDRTDLWVVLPRGVVPEDPEGFCAFAAAIRDAAWDRLAIDPSRRTSLSVSIYVAETGTVVDAGGNELGYRELCEMARRDPASLGGVDFEVALAIRPYSALWPEDAERSDLGCEPDDVDGTVSRSREWRYGTELPDAVAALPYGPGRNGGDFRLT